MEYLDRGVTAVSKHDGKAFVSWRLLASDPDAISFNVYAVKKGKTIKVNKAPVVKTTWIEDAGRDTTETVNYFVKALVKGKESAASGSCTLRAGTLPYQSLPLLTPAGYTPNDASVGDLDGDGEYEIILHQTGRAKDNSQAGITDPPLIQAYKMDGTLMWTINLGKNIREGAHYTQFMVYDLDGDGRAEIAMKTADGSTDGKGKVIGDSSKDYRNERGYILSGPEFLTIFDGLTGAALATTDYLPARHPSSLSPTTEELKEVWGDGYGNRMDRFLACVAYLDGVHPTLVMSRGYYTRTVLSAWNWNGSKLSNAWTFDSDAPGGDNRAYRGQGNHNLSVADVDGDGRDEIVFGAMTIDDNGKGLYSTGLGHGDALHVTDLDPERPGMEVFDIQERFDDAGANFRDAKTGAVIWKKASVKAGDDGEGPGRGLALDIDPRYPGYECWVAGAGISGMFDAKGNLISEKTPSVNMGIYWDGDVLSEILNGTTIDKWDYQNSAAVNLLKASQFGCASNNGTKSNPVLSADLFGDWREEVIYRSIDNKELRIFTTSIPTDLRFYTFMNDPHYRLSIAWQNVAYNQPPHTGFFMGEGMKPPARPSVTIIQPKRIAQK
ncbi:MAG: rhamnogalacturonan lyase [Gemmatimonadaceae bacterium]|nr:rhamnogalacturonan lyase [Chitinophagaceae bacterium]